MAKMLTADRLTQMLKSGNLDAPGVPSFAGLPALANLPTENWLSLLDRLTIVKPVLLAIRISDTSDPDRYAAIDLHCEGLDWKLSGIELPRPTCATWRQACRSSSSEHSRCKRSGSAGWRRHFWANRPVSLRSRPPEEEDDDWYDLFNAMTDETAPTTNLEWFTVSDVADILWDRSRLRPWKHAILVIGRNRALETALLQTQNSTLPSTHPSRIAVSRQEAEQWRTNPEKHAVLQARLNEAG